MRYRYFYRYNLTDPYEECLFPNESIPTMAPMLEWNSYTKDTMLWIEEPFSFVNLTTGLNFTAYVCMV
jgi:hypothetical protein